MVADLEAGYPSDRLDYPRADASNIQIISPLDDLALLRPRPNSRVTRGHLGEGRWGPGPPKRFAVVLSRRTADYQACMEAFARNLRMPST